MHQLTNSVNVNGAFIDDLYARYAADPASVDPSWRMFFQGYQHGLNGSAGDDHVSPAGLNAREREAAVMKLVNAYRDRGHLVANTNPVRPRRFFRSDLSLAHHRLEEADLDRVFDVGKQIRIGPATLRDIIGHLQETYCSTIGTEFRYIPDSGIRMWLHERMESKANRPGYSPEKKREILSKLSESVGFENFLHKKYTGQKRFSLEGCESFVPALFALFEHGAEWGVEEFVIGMAHRGRLNVLANLFGKSYENVFAEFEGSALPESAGAGGEGDVKYHLGYSADVTTECGNNIHLALMFNPSHLEAVDPVALGSVRAKLDSLYGEDTQRIVPVLVHGDAAISGQGVVYEIANFHNLKGYNTGGTIHIVLNNQVGFTANYRETRSSLYCTDIAKVTESPVFHVNADDPEAVVHCVRMAIELRQRFKIDVYIDLLGYRRYGHNEGDEPGFTQPLLYEAINKHPTVLKIYTDQLLSEGVVTETEAKRIYDRFQNMLEDELEQARRNRQALPARQFARQWKDFRRAHSQDFEKSPDTGVPIRRLNRIADALVTIPEEFHIYPRLERVFKNRRSLYFENQTVDWGLAEQLAWGSLLLEEHPVRVSGQDSKRGTFSHRHAILTDAMDESEYTPLNHIQKRQERFQAFNSHLSEYGVLGYEYGYATARPTALVIWEAQFGDFANGAQIIIDQFIASSETKWQRMSGLVMLLPHGNEGQGPEHSSARLERFLQLCAEDNIVVTQPTTPANFFHMLRRQQHVRYRKPLIVMTPKGLLRHKLVRSPLSELKKGRFRETIDDDQVSAESARRVVFCTGKVYYELYSMREELGITDVALIRLEQLYPIPEQQDAALLEKYAAVTDRIWFQEEAENLGAWSFIRNRLASFNLRVISRPAAASPAIGYKKLFQEHQQKLLHSAFFTDEASSVIEEREQ